MLSENGNPSIDKLAAIIGTLRKQPGNALETRGIKAARVRVLNRSRRYPTVR